MSIAPDLSVVLLSNEIDQWTPQKCLNQKTINTVIMLDCDKPNEFKRLIVSEDEKKQCVKN